MSISKGIRNVIIFVAVIVAIILAIIFIDWGSDDDKDPSSKLRNQRGRKSYSTTYIRTPRKEYNKKPSSIILSSDHNNRNIYKRPTQSSLDREAKKRQEENERIENEHSWSVAVQYSDLSILFYKLEEPGITLRWSIEFINQYIEMPTPPQEIIDSIKELESTPYGITIKSKYMPNKYVCKRVCAWMASVGVSAVQSEICSFDVAEVINHKVVNPEEAIRLNLELEDLNIETYKSITKCKKLIYLRLASVEDVNMDFRDVTVTEHLDTLEHLVLDNCKGPLITQLGPKLRKTNINSVVMYQCKIDVLNTIIQEYDRGPGLYLQNLTVTETLMVDCLTSIRNATDVSIENLILGPKCIVKNAYINRLNSKIEKLMVPSYIYINITQACLTALTNLKLLVVQRYTFTLNGIKGQTCIETIVFHSDKQNINHLAITATITIQNQKIIEPIDNLPLYLYSINMPIIGNEEIKSIILQLDMPVRTEMFNPIIRNIAKTYKNLTKLDILQPGIIHNPQQSTLMVEIDDFLCLPDLFTNLTNYTVSCANFFDEKNTQKIAPNLVTDILTKHSIICDKTATSSAPTIYTPF
ncbi:hypothetical protein NEOKW01_0605 [Nematocida sp. AWRm80]|nr:hypothetical protein NEOKW01_0605 [Nematocida sp. AWRm80]